MPAMAEWKTATIDVTRIDSVDQEYIQTCTQKQREAEKNNQVSETYIRDMVARGAATEADLRKKYPLWRVPDCSMSKLVSDLLTSATDGFQGGTWGDIKVDPRDSTQSTLYTVINFTRALHSALVVSEDKGRSWHVRHLFLHEANETAKEFNLDISPSGIIYVAGKGLRMSLDNGLSFRTITPQIRMNSVKVSPFDEKIIIAGGPSTDRPGEAIVSIDGGQSWRDLDLQSFILTLPIAKTGRAADVRNLQFDKTRGNVIYVGTGVQFYRYTFAPGFSSGQWEAMDGANGSEVYHDSTVYNIDVTNRLMISTCNGVYQLAEESPGISVPEGYAHIKWKKHRNATFAIAGGAGANLRSYYVSQNPYNPDQVLAADTGALYFGRFTSAGSKESASWSRVEELPYRKAPHEPEYSSVLWLKDSVIVGTRNIGLFYSTNSLQ